MICDKCLINSICTEICDQFIIEMHDVPMGKIIPEIIGKRYKQGLISELPLGYKVIIDYKTKIIESIDKYLL